MMRRTSRGAMAVLTAVLLATAFQTTPSANHSWGGYHWARTANPFLLKLGDNVGPAWDATLATTSADWSVSNVLNTVVVAGGVSPKTCRPTAGQVEVCNATYGNNGWLGVAQIWVTGTTHISQATVKLNDTYFNKAQYNTPAWRNLVSCQEVGHTFGLDHQDETFGNPNLGTCMDYTNDPSTNQHPNAHDYQELELIYAHVDSSTTIKSSNGNAHADVPQEWGQLMSSSHGGRQQVFEREFGNGNKIVTFVVWAD